MNRELINVIEQIGREKGIDKEILFEALESALLSASRKTLGPADNVRMHIDRKSGDLRVYCRKKVVEEVTDDKLEISLADAKALNKEAELGDELELEQERPPQEVGRIAAQTAKQVILQKVRDAEREGIYSEFAGKEGQILRGVVHRIEKRNVILEIGKAEAILPAREQIPGERYNPGDRIRAYVLEVRRTAKGPQLSLSRTHPGYLARPFETEIPEIHDGIVLVQAMAPRHAPRPQGLAGGRGRADGGRGPAAAGPRGAGRARRGGARRAARRGGARLACGDREGRTREARARRGGRLPRRGDPRRGRRVGGGPRRRVRAEWSLRGNGCARMTEEPRRTCLGCRRVRPKRVLVRLVRRRDGVVVTDPRGAVPGRGAYVCADDLCLGRALARARLTHAFRKPCEASAELAMAVRTSGSRGAGAPPSEASEEMGVVQTSRLRGVAVRGAPRRRGGPVIEAPPSEASGENGSEEVRGPWRQR